MTTTLLNPFSVSLDKYPFTDVATEPIYTNGDYRIYKAWKEHFIHTFKNIIIAQRCAANKALIDGLVNDIKPTGEADLYHDYERPKGAILKGIEAANKLNFKLV
ncbi:MAG: hypothetical protein ACKVQB_07480 [Bacteroidia bacterium]